MVNGILHVYGQKAWHDDVYILGDQETMRALADAILRALAGKPSRARKVRAYTNDREGYDVFVAYLSDERELSKLALPYSDPIARERDENAMWPEVIGERGNRAVCLRCWKAGRR